MAIFKRNLRVNQFQKMSTFYFLSSCIYSLEKCFFVLDYRKRHVLAYFALKKLEEWLFLEQNHGLTPFKICQFFDFLNFFIAQKGFFFFYNIVKDIFLPFIAQKKVGKMTIFGPRPWVNPIEKMSIFRLFKLLDFIDQKGGFFVLEYYKRHFPGLYCLKEKSWKNGHFRTKTMG